MFFLRNHTTAGLPQHVVPGTPPADDLDGGRSISTCTSIVTEILGPKGTGLFLFPTDGEGDESGN